MEIEADEEEYTKEHAHTWKELKNVQKITPRKGRLPICRIPVNKPDKVELKEDKVVLTYSYQDMTQRITIDFKKGTFSFDGFKPIGEKERHENTLRLGMRMQCMQNAIMQTGHSSALEESLTALNRQRDQLTKEQFKPFKFTGFVQLRSDYKLLRLDSFACLPFWMEVEFA